SNVAHFSYTLHVPSGTQAVKIQRTRGASASYESVNVVSDTSGGYTADVLATSSDGNSYAVTFSIHVTDKGSAWYSADGTTNQDVAVSIPAS
ncbi:MAG: hypothetical protein ACRDFX_14070, partial [Chloroflexota bacterium]